MTALVVLVLILLAILLGYLVGRWQHYRFLAAGFRIMLAQVDDRGLGDAHMDDLSCSAADVSRAFGRLRDGGPS